AGGTQSVFARRASSSPIVRFATIEAATTALWRVAMTCAVRGAWTTIRSRAPSARRSPALLSASGCVHAHSAIWAAWASASVADRTGAPLEVTGDLYGDEAAAVYAVVVDAFSRVGEQLGLGAFQRAAISGPTTSSLLAAEDRGLVAIAVDPRKPMAAIERML